MDTKVRVVIEREYRIKIGEDGSSETVLIVSKDEFDALLDAMEAEVAQ